MNTLKDVPGPDGKPVEICLEGKKCSLFCQWRQSINESLTGKRVPFCSLFHIHHHDIETKGETPHPNCLGSSLDTGPVDFGSVKPGERYWMTSPENSIDNPVEEIEIIEKGAHYCQQAYIRVDGLMLDGEKIDYILRRPLEIYKHKKYALKRAAELLQEAIEKINKNLQEVKHEKRNRFRKTTT